MPRKNRTAKSNRPSRRKDSGFKTSLIAFSKRWGWRAAGVFMLLWLGGWLYLGGFIDRAYVATENKIYDELADAGFYIEDIYVEGRVHTDADVLRALINVEKGDPLFAFNPDEAKDMIERIAWVKEAHVERRLPRTIYIGLLERKPLALWQHKGKIRVIDEDGVTITDRKKSEFKELIIVTGANAPKQTPSLRMLLDAEPDVAKRVEAASWIGDRRWDLKLSNGTVIKLPETDPALAVSRLAKAQKDDRLLDKRLKSIDIRNPDRIMVRTLPGAVQDYKATYKKGDAI